MTAGKALDRDNTAGYNCSFLAVDGPRSFSETMYILMCGTGVGFSVERQYINQLPTIPEELEEVDYTIEVADSKRGWAESYNKLVHMLYEGKIPKWDVSKIRPAGARLKTFGGRASGPNPLIDLFKYTVETFRSAQGRKLTSLECHDLMCKIGDIVVVGGVRRSALISLSNLTDQRMRRAKQGQWWEEAPHRALANNSVAYTEKPDAEAFMAEWLALVASKSGERGIFSRVASQKQAAKNGRRDSDHEFGTNPCSEIILRNKQFCNLTEVVVRPTDTLDDLKNKVRIATILGTLQSNLTHFPYLSAKWKQNTEEERLLGVSLTGIMDHPFLSGRDPYYFGDTREPDILEDGSFSRSLSIYPECTLEDVLEELKQEAIDTNAEWADKLGIPRSTAITCVKPSGTVSQLVDSASGIHARHSHYYIRTVRADNKDPLCEFMKDQGVPHEPDVNNPDHVTVFSFPIKAPENAVTRNDMSAIEQLELWKVYQEHWCEHKPSVTITVRDSEWMEVGAWVYRHFDSISGVSFLPHSDHTYRQAPYQEITEDEYYEAQASFPQDIEWERLSEYEDGDKTTGSQEMACSAGACDIL